MAQKVGGRASLALTALPAMDKLYQISGLYRISFGPKISYKPTDTNTSE